MNKALVVGSAGQDGTLLCEQLNAAGYDVLGLSKSSGHSIDNAAEVESIVASFQPDEIYFLAAFHHSSEDAAIEPLELFRQSYTVHVTGLLHFLEAMRKNAPSARLFYAASSLIFGDVIETPQTEDTPLRPTCAYGITKSAGLQICRYYRKTHSLRASVGILYNHESPLRREKFVSKKIVKAAWAIKRGQQAKLVLGNLDAALDWGYAPDFVHAMRAIVALEAADDFIVATGEAHTVRDFVELAFAQVGVDWRTHVEENRALITRPPLRRIGDARKLASATGWRPATSFPEMVRALMNAEEQLSREPA